MATKWVGKTHLSYTISSEVRRKKIQIFVFVPQNRTSNPNVFQWNGSDEASCNPPQSAHIHPSLSNIKNDPFEFTWAGGELGIDRVEKYYNTSKTDIWTSIPDILFTGIQVNYIYIWSLIFSPVMRSGIWDHFLVLLVHNDENVLSDLIAQPYLSFSHSKISYWKLHLPIFEKKSPYTNWESRNL